MKIYFTIIFSFLCLMDAKASQPLLSSSIEPSSIAQHTAAKTINERSASTVAGQLGSVDKKAEDPQTRQASIVPTATPKIPKSQTYKPHISAQRLSTLVNFCAPCHGSLGVAKESIYPHLAGQSAQFLYKQLQAYKYKQRKNIIMQGMVSRLNKQDMLALAQYYANLDSSQKRTDSAIPATPATEKNL